MDLVMYKNIQLMKEPGQQLLKEILGGILSQQLEMD